MTQPLLFKELEFNRDNLRKWAEQEVETEPQIEVYVSKGGDTHRELVPNTVERVLRDVLANNYACHLNNYKVSELAEMLVDLAREGVPHPIDEMPLDVLLDEIVDEFENWDAKTMEDFAALPVVTGDF